MSLSSPISEIHEHSVWKRQPQAQALVNHYIEELTRASHELACWRQKLIQTTSCDWIHFLDHIALSDIPVDALQQAGFIYDGVSQSWFHVGAQLPRFRKVIDKKHVGLYLRVDSLEACLNTNRCSLESIEGTAFSHYRRACVLPSKECSLWVVERRSQNFAQPEYESREMVQRVAESYLRWRSRDRGFKNERQAWAQAKELASQMVIEVGRERAASIILEVEREYWQQRCLAGAVQKLRQDRLGLGWGNHDHHTFRCSRDYFSTTVTFFEILGFTCRERFYAGEQAGWGAQVMENAASGHVLFLDVDLSADELSGDFAHEGLVPRHHLGTIGLWCALHGESLLQAGMHHLEGQFLFEQLRQDLNGWGIGFMKPFSDMSYLRQAFSAPEYWPVELARLEQLLRSGRIRPEEYDRFAKEGAVGSHLENLQRDEGYKGFNQKNVSYIIQATDPRTIKT